MTDDVLQNILFFEKDRSVGAWKAKYVPPVGSTVWLDVAEEEDCIKTAPYRVLSVDCHRDFVRAHVEVEYDYHRATQQSA